MLGVVRAFGRNYAIVLVLFSLIAAPFSALAAEGSYVVKEGETLSRIAGDLGVPLEALAQANAIDDPNKVAAGLMLKLPPEAAGGLRRLLSSDYTVQPGETLTAIATKYGITVEALVATNQMAEPDRLLAGAKVKLPDGGRPPKAEGRPEIAVSPTLPLDAPPSPRLPIPPSAPSAVGARRSITVPYLVKPGDTLAGIARGFETSVTALSSTNGLANPDVLMVGQAIDVPVKTLEHQVAQGETLAAIAAKYAVDLGSVVDFNALADPNLIRVGEALAIPRAVGLAQAEMNEQPLVATALQAPVPAPAPPAIEPPAAFQAPAQTQAPPVATAASAGPKPVASQPAPTAQSAGNGQPNAEQAVKAPQTPAPAGSQSVLAGAALRLLGKPYAWGGSNESGFDCSGYVWFVAKQAGISISRGLQGQFNAGPHPDRTALRAGDLVFFQNTYMPGLSHNGMYLGEGKFAHAADERSGVTVSRLDDVYWSSRWFGATRVGA